MVITRRLISGYELGSIPKGSTKYFMTEQKNETTQDTWAGATKEFFRQLGSVATLLIFLSFTGQACGVIDIYRLLGK